MSEFSVARLDASRMSREFELDEEVPEFQNLPKPINYRVLLYPRPIPTESEGGIIIPEETRNDMRHARGIGKILAMGDTAFQHESLATADQPKVGDWVWIPVYGGNFRQHLGTLRGEIKPFDLRVVRDCDIEGIYEDGLLDVLGY